MNRTTGRGDVSAPGAHHSGTSPSDVVKTVLIRAARLNRISNKPPHRGKARPRGRTGDHCHASRIGGKR
jgi:hypothetical protein